MVWNRDAGPNGAPQWCEDNGTTWIGAASDPYDFANGASISGPGPGGNISLNSVDGGSVAVAAGATSLTVSPSGVAIGLDAGAFAIGFGVTDGGNTPGHFTGTPLMYQTGAGGLDMNVGNLRVDGDYQGGFGEATASDGDFFTFTNEGWTPIVASLMGGTSTQPQAVFSPGIGGGVNVSTALQGTGAGTGMYFQGDIHTTGSTTYSWVATCVEGIGTAPLTQTAPSASYTITTGPASLSANPVEFSIQLTPGLCEGLALYRSTGDGGTDAGPYGFVDGGFILTNTNLGNVTAGGTVYVWDNGGSPLWTLPSGDDTGGLSVPQGQAVSLDQQQSIDGGTWMAVRRIDWSGWPVGRSNRPKRRERLGRRRWLVQHRRDCDRADN